MNRQKIKNFLELEEFNLTHRRNIFDYDRDVYVSSGCVLQNMKHICSMYVF